MSFSSRAAAWWTPEKRGGTVSGFVGLWILMIATAVLFPAIVGELENPVPDLAPTSVIFSLVPLLVIVGAVLLLVGWALGVWKTPTAEDERG